MLSNRIKGLNETTILRSSVLIILGKTHLVSIRNYPHFTVMYLDKKWVDMKAKTENFMTREESLNIFTRGVPKYFQRNETLGFHLNSVGYIHSLRVVREELRENITNSKIPSRFSFSGECSFY
ncbi:hypothetical protein AVEN_155501-1 [Araneus ventricosus]|uniref:Uncharacterized protein n=1 Tax=Araneus ventricosus TaxID=182803 RepID=A0A4Y2V4W6_ARAVE|nr:hypothetical protein AVEN_190734-1 [Araneus ventricosus]GBO19112.1 hypothetical protein AVEN_155501-1 [Araneus ventricosus]